MIDDKGIVTHKLDAAETNDREGDIAERQDGSPFMTVAEVRKGWRYGKPTPEAVARAKKQIDEAKAASNG